MLKSGFSDRIKKVRNKGFSYALNRAASLAISPFYVNRVLYQFDVDLTRELPVPSAPQSCTHRILDKKDLHMLEKIVNGNSIKRYRERFENGMICFATVRNGQIINFMWSSLKDHLDDDYRFNIKVNENEAYSLDGYSENIFRRQGLFLPLFAYHFLFLRSLKVKNVSAIQHKADLLGMYPKFVEIGLPIKLVKTIRYRKVLFWKREKWSDYDGHLGL